MLGHFCQQRTQFVARTAFKRLSHNIHSEMEKTETSDKCQRVKNIKCRPRIKKIHNKDLSQQKLPVYMIILIEKGQIRYMVFVKSM